MEGDFQKDAQELCGPTDLFPKITARIKGTPREDFHGGESAARFKFMATRDGKTRDVATSV